MGYARLAEGRVEKMSVPEEIDRALDEVFPHAVGFEVKIERDFAPDLPPLLMQRGHLSAVLVNLLQNAREAMGGHGQISVSARTAPGYSVEIVIQDDGPGISTEQTERIFEAYFTTKEKGTGLGLAIVKHNVDLYGGKIRVESALGKGCRFVLVFPAKTLVSSQKNFST
jgi:signal transduction histidine kinase